MLDKIHFYSEKLEEIDFFLMQTYVQEKEITLRWFADVEKCSPEKGYSSVQLTEQDLLSNRNLDGIFTYNDKNYQCIANNTISVSEHMLEPYKEIYFCYRLPTTDVDSVAGGQNYCFFEDRLGETYFSKAKNAQWSAKIKTLDIQYLYRFIIQPDTNLLTAPVVCMSTSPLITNLTFDQKLAFDYDTHMEILGPWVDNHKPIITIDGPEEIAPNETVTLQVSVTHTDGTLNTDSCVYVVDAKQGYVPDRELKIENGKGSFRISALGLQPNEQIRVKVNDKTWTGYAEKTLVVRQK